MDVGLWFAKRPRELRVKAGGWERLGVKVEGPVLRGEVAVREQMEKLALRRALPAKNVPAMGRDDIGPATRW